MAAPDTAMGWLPFVSLIALPAFGYVIRVLQQHVRDDDERYERLHSRVNETKDALANFKLDVSQGYASSRAMERLENKLDEMGRRLEHKLDELGRRRAGDYDQHRREPAE